MIYLTRLNSNSLVVNSDLIKFVEITPDTVITLVTGEKLVVLESVQQVLERISQFRQTYMSCSGALSSFADRRRDAIDEERSK
jgi:flagellar protein FlbD